MFLFSTDISICIHLLFLRTQGLNQPEFSFLSYYVCMLFHNLRNFLLRTLFAVILESGLRRSHTYSLCFSSWRALRWDGQVGRCMVYRSVGAVQSSKHSAFSSSGSLLGELLFALSLDWEALSVATMLGVLSPRVKREHLIAIGGRFALLSLEMVKVGQLGEGKEFDWGGWIRVKHLPLDNFA